MLFHKGPPFNLKIEKKISSLLFNRTLGATQAWLASSCVFRNNLSINFSRKEIYEIDRTNLYAFCNIDFVFLRRSGPLDKWQFVMCFRYEQWQCEYSPRYSKSQKTSSK